MKNIDYIELVGTIVGFIFIMCLLLFPAAVLALIVTLMFKL